MKVLTSCLLVLLLLGCTTTSAQVGVLSADPERFTVVLNPNLDENRLDILSPPQGWDKVDKKNGWVGFDLNESGTVTFIMNELPSKSVCTDDPETSAGWVITKFELTKNGKKETQKGHNFGTQQKGWIERAFPQMNPDDGSVLNADKSKASISFVLDNLNNDDKQRTSYYQVTATRCSDGLSLMTDPGIGNRGTE